MFNSKRFILVGIIFLLSVALTIPITGMRAQGQLDTVTLTVAIPDILRDVFNDQLIGDFESSHPGIKLQVVGSNQQIPFAASAGTTKYFEELQKYANAADLLYVDLDHLNSSLATQAGYFLDLSPLISADSSLHADDFVASAWQNYQWDKGMWALPISASTLVMAYDPPAFDKAGIAYPSDQWTLDDLASAVRALGQKDASGKVTSPGLAVFPESPALVFLSLLGAPLVDSSTIPNPPQLEKPGLAAMMDTWAKLDQEGWIGTDFTRTPIAIVPIEVLMTQGINANQTDRKLVGALLPGGKSGLNVQGFAISAGTLHPDQAYELAKFLTTRPELGIRFLGTSARKNLTRPQGQGNQIGPVLQIPPEVQKLNDDALTHALTLADFRYGDYLIAALANMKKDGLDGQAALQAEQLEAVNAQTAALAQKDKVAITVATPIPQATANASEITLNFGFTSFIRPIPNLDRWNQVLVDFAANDPQVGKVNFNIHQGGPNQSNQDECYFLPFNSVPDADLTQLLNLDPFLTADNTFDKSDMLGSLLSQVQRENKIWALPITLEPSVLTYNTDAFSKANLPDPGEGWTMAAFLDALKALKVDSSDSAPFVPRGIGGAGQYPLMLIAADGGIPLDYRTTPPTVNFTDSATVEAIRQILDLAKQGYIKYGKLANPPFKPIMLISVGEQDTAPIYTDVLNAISFQRFNDPAANTGTNPYKLTMYPRGSKYSAIAYTMSTAYISSQAQNPEACYRLIKTIAAHPELFGSMPTRSSLLNSPAFKASQRSDLTGLYSQIDSLLQDPNTIAFPSGFIGGGAARQVLEYWLFRAFDKYVLENGDLDSSLAEAQSFAKAFLECVATTPPPPQGSVNSASLDAYKNCAEKIDPSMK